MELIVDGRPVYVGTGGREHAGGNGAGGETAVVFLHGAACDHSVWALPARYFAHRRRRVLAVDLPGHGRSAGPPLASVDALGDWVEAVLDAAAVDRAAVVGHSMGALIGLALAARRPARVAALVMIAAAAPMPVHPDYLALAAANDHKAIELMNDWAVSRLSHLGGNPMPGLWLIGQNTRLTERHARDALAVDLHACHAYGDGVAATRAVRCPTLVILGQHDQMVPLRVAQPFARQFAKAEIVVLAGCGHWPMGEQPDAVLDALIRYL